MQVGNNPNLVPGAQPIQQGHVAMGHGPQRVHLPPPADIDTGADKPPFQAIADALEIDESGFSSKHLIANFYQSTYQYEIGEMTQYKGNDGKMYYQVVVNRKITVPPSTTPIEIKNKVVQTLVPVPDPLTDRAAERIEKLVRLNVGATEKRMEQGVKFFQVRKTVMDEKFIVCLSTDRPGPPVIRRDGSVGAFDVYALKAHTNGGFSQYPVHRLGDQVGISSDPFMESYRDFTHVTSAPLRSDIPKYLTKLKDAEKLVHELVRAAGIYPDYDSKLSALHKLLEEDPPINLDKLLSTMERNTIDDLYALKHYMPPDRSSLLAQVRKPWDEQAQAASEAYKKAELALELFKQAEASVQQHKAILHNMDGQPHDPQQRTALVNHIQNLERDLANTFDACAKPLMADTYNRVQGNLMALQHFCSGMSPEALSLSETRNHTRLLSALQGGANGETLAAYRSLQNRFIEKAGEAGPRFAAMLEARMLAALQARAPIPKAPQGADLLRP